jgi:hypothetical protein
MRSDPDKVAAVVAALREAGGDKERPTAKWIETAMKNPPLAHALKAVFGRKPTTQRLGVWLSENLGAQSDKYVLEGHHCGHSKAWRYAVRLIGETAEKERQARAAEDTKRAADDRMRIVLERVTAENKARFEAEKEARRAAKAPKPVAVLVQAPPEPPKPAAPPGHFTPLTTQRVDGTGRIVRTPILGRDGMPVPAVPEAKPERVPNRAEPKPLLDPGPMSDWMVEPAAPPGSPHDSPWVRENRQPTRAELAARHHQTESGWRDDVGMLGRLGNGVTGPPRGRRF